MNVMLHPSTSFCTDSKNRKLHNLCKIQALCKNVNADTCFLRLAAEIKALVLSAALSFTSALNLLTYFSLFLSFQPTPHSAAE